MAERVALHPCPSNRFTFSNPPECTILRAKLLRLLSWEGARPLPHPPPLGRLRLPRSFIQYFQLFFPFPILIPAYSDRHPSTNLKWIKSSKWNPKIVSGYFSKLRYQTFHWGWLLAFEHYVVIARTQKHTDRQSHKANNPSELPGWYKAIEI